MQITPCKSYHAQTVGQTVLRMADDRSAFKIYYLSVIGRDKPEQYEWQQCRQKPADFEITFRKGGYEGIGFVTAFPHVTKIFRFSPTTETVLDVREFHTEGMRPMDCSRPDGYHEFACYAEAAIAADEYRSWARVGSVEEYLAFRSHAADFPVASNAKLATYWKGTH